MPNLMTCNDSKFTIRMVVRIAAAVIVYLDEGLRKKMVVAICSRDRDALQLMTRKTTKIGDGAKSYTVTSPPDTPCGSWPEGALHDPIHLLLASRAIPPCCRPRSRIQVRRHHRPSVSPYHY